jgi:tetratricopeptide (TPR) repeat protein
MQIIYIFIELLIALFCLFELIIVIHTYRIGFTIIFLICLIYSSWYCIRDIPLFIAYYFYRKNNFVKMHKAIKYIKFYKRFSKDNKAFFYFLVGVDNFANKNWNEAISNFTTCIDIKGNIGKDKYVLYFYLSLAYVKLNNINEAKEYVHYLFESDNPKILEFAKKLQEDQSIE